MKVQLQNNKDRSALSALATVALVLLAATFAKIEAAIQLVHSVH
jgi:hypothetical protein